MSPTAASLASSLELGPQKRRHPRHRVHLEVRYGSARDYVVEYAENLSRGGLFIRGVFDVEPLRPMALQIVLPGYDVFGVEARVVHVRRPADAVAIGASPGVGLELVEVPDGFDAALHLYLERLGHRSDFAVLSTNREVTSLLADAGYRAVAAPPPGQIDEAIANAAHPILALAVGRRERDAYINAEPLAIDLVEIDFLGEIDEILDVLDAILVAALKT